jgi:Family of unknown function (DUF6459)
VTAISSAGVTVLSTASPLKTASPNDTRESRRQSVTAMPLAQSVTATPLARIRSRPIPDISPPVIDSRRVVLQELSPFIQGTLAISFSAGFEAVADPADPEDPAYFGPQRTLASDLPDPKTWVTHMAQALIEVMSGARPAPQVIRWTTPAVYSAVARRNAASGRRRLVARRAIVRQVRICEPVDGVIEACAVVVDNGRVRALAMRLTGVDRCWVVSELQVG